MNCPCGTESPFEECCGPFLFGEKFPETAEQLMRSRYTAYVKADIKYLENTMVPESREDFDPIETRQWAESSTWKGLKILDTREGGTSDTTGMVEFTATYEKEGQGIDHHEVSQFRKNKEGRWLFVDGEAHTHPEGEEHHETPPKPIVRDRPKVGRNEPCPCGSNKKYKKCCEGKEV
jgi:SEC-C motif-containing protein